VFAARPVMFAVRLVTLFLRRVRGEEGRERERERGGGKQKRKGKEGREREGRRWERKEKRE
jgi:hypothetical protein